MLLKLGGKLKMRHLTEDMIEKLGKYFVYHVYGGNTARMTAKQVDEIENLGITIAKPNISFEQFVRIWQRGDDVGEIISTIEI
jgi:hypothetical protein